jgi:hypothetical protein
MISMISWLGWTASSTLTPERFVLHACVQALFTIKLPEQRNKINKPHSQAGGHRNGDGQHIGHADNTAAGSEDTSDNT